MGCGGSKEKEQDRAVVAPPSEPEKNDFLKRDSARKRYLIKYEVEKDADGNEVLDENGKPKLKLDENGEPIPMRDANGNIIFELDADGNPIPVKEESVSPLSELKEMVMGDPLNPDDLDEYATKFNPGGKEEGGGYYDADGNHIPAEVTKSGRLDKGRDKNEKPEVLKDGQKIRRSKLVKKVKKKLVLDYDPRKVKDAPGAVKDKKWEIARKGRGFAEFSDDEAYADVVKGSKENEILLKAIAFAPEVAEGKHNEDIDFLERGWYYADKKKQVHGPFLTPKIHKWFMEGKLTPKLWVRPPPNWVVLRTNDVTKGYSPIDMFFKGLPKSKWFSFVPFTDLFNAATSEADAEILKGEGESRHANYLLNAIAPNLPP